MWSIPLAPQAVLLLHKAELLPSSLLGFARCSSLSQSMLTQWVCWSDNSLRLGGCAHGATGASGHLAMSLQAVPKLRALPAGHPPTPAWPNPANKDGSQERAGLPSLAPLPDVGIGRMAMAPCPRRMQQQDQHRLCCHRPWSQVTTSVSPPACVSLVSSPVKWVQSLRAPAWPPLSADVCIYLPPPYLHLSHEICPKLTHSPPPLSLLHVHLLHLR